MNIEILGTESLGVRGMCCFVETESRKILIDPGIALGYKRNGMLPHPYQVAVGEKINNKIIKRWSEATDVVLSHFHGDHVPLNNANPYQLDLKKLIGLNQGLKIWTKGLSSLSMLEKKRAVELSFILGNDLIDAEEKKDGILTFSGPVPHGDNSRSSTKVIMTRIEEGIIFVHASDMQLFDNAAISRIIDWEPDIVFVDGPPLYLSERIPKKQINIARNNAVKLSKKIPLLIIDHHLMRNVEGESWLKSLRPAKGNKIICGADFMDKPRKLLEARRKDLYEYMPVGKEWHEMYSRRKTSID